MVAEGNILLGNKDCSLHYINSHSFENKMLHKIKIFKYFAN